MASSQVPFLPQTCTAAGTTGSPFSSTAQRTSGLPVVPVELEPFGLHCAHPRFAKQYSGFWRSLLSQMVAFVRSKRPFAVQAAAASTERLVSGSMTVVHRDVPSMHSVSHSAEPPLEVFVESMWQAPVAQFLKAPSLPFSSHEAICLPSVPPHSELFGAHSPPHT